MSRLRKKEKVVTVGVFALGLAVMLVIIVAPLAFAQEAATTPTAQLSHTKSQTVSETTSELLQEEEELSWPDVVF